MKLYQLQENYLNLLDLLEDESIPAEMVRAALKEVEGSIEDKSENVVKLIKSIEADIKALKEEEQKLYNRRKVLESKKDNLKDYLESTLKAIGKQKLKGGIFTLSIQKNAPRLIIEDYKAIPEEYITTETTTIVFKDEVKEALKNGIEVPGAKLESTESLRIR